MNSQSLCSHSFYKFMNGYIFTFLPICCRQVADQLISGKKVLPENYSCITVLLSDICGFTTLASSATPIQVSLVDKVAVIVLYNTCDLKLIALLAKLST